MTLYIVTQGTHIRWVDVNAHRADAVAARWVTRLGQSTWTREWRLW